MSVKKYGGIIQDWYKSEVNDEWKEAYGGNLGFVIYGRLDSDPTSRGFAGYPLRTSLVVKFSDTQIETLNTIYDLGEPLARST